MAKEVWLACDRCGRLCTTGTDARGRQVVAACDIPRAKLGMKTYQRGESLYLCAYCFDIPHTEAV